MNPTTALVNRYAQSVAQGGSPLNQVTPGSVNFQPGLTPPPAAPMPDKSPATNFTPTQMRAPVPQGLPQGGTSAQMATLPIQDANPQQPGVQVPKSEAELIIKALDSRMKALSNIHTMAAQSAFPQPEQPTAQGA